MIVFIDGPLGSLNGKPIVRWEVRFVTLQGWFKTLPEAIENANLINMPFELIQPHSVAVTEDGEWEPTR